MNESFKDITDPRMFDNGRRVAFTVEREDGMVLRVACQTQELGNLISLLALIGVNASENAPAIFDQTPGAQLSGIPIPSFGLGFGQGESPEITLLVVNLRGFQLAFQIPSSDLIRLSADVSRIAKTLAADPSKRN